MNNRMQYLFQDYSLKQGWKKWLSILRIKFAINKDVRFCYFLRKMYYYSQRHSHFSHLFRNYYNNLLKKEYCCYISVNSSMGKKAIFPHPFGIVIGEGVVIGNNVTIYHCVTLGRKYKDVAEYPIVEDGVVVYSHSSILGKVTVKKGTVLGCHSLLLQDTLEDSTYSGIPARRR